MSNWIKSLKEKIIEYWITIPLAITGYLLTKTYDDIVVLVLPEIIHKVPSILLLKLLLLSVLLNLALFFAFYIIKNKYDFSETTIINGIYWDHMFNPLCPSCKTPLHQESLNKDPLFIPKLICPNGHFNKHLMDGGVAIHPDTFRYELLKVNKIIK